MSAITSPSSFAPSDHSPRAPRDSRSSTPSSSAGAASTSPSIRITSRSSTSRPFALSPPTRTLTDELQIPPPALQSPLRPLRPCCPARRAPRAPELHRNPHPPALCGGIPHARHGHRRPRPRQVHPPRRLRRRLRCPHPRRLHAPLLLRALRPHRTARRSLWDQGEALLRPDRAM